MSIDRKAFGISDSLVSAVTEALKGGQKKIDVAPPFGKLTGADFKKLRNEGPEEKDVTNPKQGNSVDPKQRSIGEGGNPVNKAKKNAAVSAVGAKNRDDHYLDRMNPDVADKIRGREKMSGKDRQWHEEVEIDEVSDAAKKVIGAVAKKSGGKIPFTSTTYKDGKKVVTRGHNDEKGNRVVTSVKNEEVDHIEDTLAEQIAARKTEVQNKIAQKQMNTMQAKANKRLSNINASNCKCEGNCKCDDKGSAKGGKEPIEVNPPMREATELPKKVVTKGHEIAKSLIKHKSKVREPYAVGMATAKKSAGIKEDAEQVDELSKATLKSYKNAAKWDINGIKTNAPSNYEFDRDAMLKRRQAGMKMANKKLNKKD